MIIEIQYRDKANWTKISGKVIDWTNYSKKFKKERIQPYYVAPEIIKDVWNGREHDVQHTSWTSYFCEFNIKESEIESIRQLKSCSDIRIIQYNETTSGTIINNSFENIDLISADYFEISEPARVADTTGWKVSIIFRTDRTVINKGLPVDNTNKISFQNNIWKEDVLNSIASINKATKLTDNEFATSTGADIRKYELVNDAWQSVGNQLVTAYTNLDISALDSTSVALISETGNLETYSFDGTDWSKTGNTFAISATPSPVITAMTSTRVAVYDDTVNQISCYDFDGVNWTLTGAALSITAGDADICTLSSSKIALIDFSSGELRDYDFSGAAWTVNQTIATTLTGTIGITTIDTNRIAITSTLEDKIQSYKLSTTWAKESTEIQLTASSGIIEATEIDKVYVSASTESGIYSYGIYNYYSDYDVLDWVKDTEIVEVQWFDNSVKQAQKTSKLGYEYVQYILTSDHDTFINFLKTSKLTKINDIEINEVEFEKALIAYNLYKIVVRGVASTEVTTDYLDSNQAYYISLNDGISPELFYTDYVDELISEEASIDTVENQTGVNTATKSISKVVKQMKFYKSEADAFRLKKKFELYADTGVINGVDNVLERRTVAPSRLGYDLYEVVITALTATTDN